MLYYLLWRSLGYNSFSCVEKYWQYCHMFTIRHMIEWLSLSHFTSRSLEIMSLQTRYCCICAPFGNALTDRTPRRIWSTNSRLSTCWAHKSVAQCKREARCLLCNKRITVFYELLVEWHELFEFREYHWKDGGIEPWWKFLWWRQSRIMLRLTSKGNVHTIDVSDEQSITVRQKRNNTRIVP